MKRQLWHKATTEDVTMTQDTELTPEQMAAYVRQSSDHSVKENVESAGLQLSGAQQYAVSHGLDAGKIMVAHEGEGKRGVSGTLRIDQREKLQEIMASIKADKIKVVWAYTVSRLFRDPYGIQVGTFIQACAEHGVKVVIATQVFDFRNENDVLMFKLLSSVSSKENEERVRWMKEAKQRKAMRGEYTGRQLTPGYIIDRNKGSKTFDHYIPYEPHAEICRKLYARFRQLNGQFNVLANEVAAMPFVFPAFDSSVDPKDVHQLRLKKVCQLHGQQCDCEQDDCILVGYQIGKPALLRLLTAVEYAGYWKFNGELLTDETGTPKINHEPIIPLDDWQYAFNLLSFVTLEGEENTARVNQRANWTPVKSGRVEPLLCGMLTSPLGTVNYTVGKYKIMEKRDGKPARSGTLTIDAKTVDRLFLERLHDRYDEVGETPYKRVLDELTAVRANNAKALVSVDEQIAQYEKSIRNKQDGLATLVATFGKDLNKETAKRLNDDINSDQTNLKALLAKKNAANAEESQLLEMFEKIDLILIGKFDREVTRRFIRLATDKIELDEYSGHFCTLTIYWSAPFSQIDVCYIWLPDGVHETWSEHDKQDLAALYPHADRLEILQRFPTRSWSSIFSYANNPLGLSRNTSLNTSGIPINLALKDVEIMRSVGIEPGNKAEYDDIWVTDVSDLRLVGNV